MPTDRRQFVAAGVAVSVGALVGAPSALASHAPRHIGLGFSLYGMRSLAIGEAIRVCREIGYVCVELPIMAGWPADSARISPAQLANARDQLRDAPLRLSALMDNLTLLTSPDVHAANLERIRAAGKLAHALAPDAPPLLETILGGRPADWPQVRTAMVERLRDWASAADEVGITLAIKPHIAGTLHTPEDAAWLIEQVAHPRLRAAFDFSHYQLRGLKLNDCLEKLLKHSVFVHVKDGTGTPEKFQFLLPGQGTIDYTDYFRQLRARGYSGDVVVEVSAQLHSQPQYDPLVAARQSYSVLATAAREAGLNDG